jgi:hypothetical protein
MLQKAPRGRLLAIICLFVTLAGCAHGPPPPIVLDAPEKAKPESLRWAIEAALAQRRWTITEREPGRIRAKVASQATAQHAIVDIRYGSGAVEIDYVDQGVGWSRYDRWVQLLTAELQKSVAQVGMGHGR